MNNPVIINICNMEQLASVINRGIMKGCCKCNAEFEEDDFAYALETGTCQYCHEVLDKVKGN